MSQSFPDLTDLIQAFLDGRATDAETDLLNDILLSAPDTREAYVRLADIHSCLAVDEQLWVAPADQSLGDRSMRLPARPRASMLTRPLPAAVLGLAIGMLCASLTFGYVMPLMVHRTPLVSETFEGGRSPLSLGMPSTSGGWSGDSSEVVGRTQGVSPHSGDRMLRLLRADYPGKSRQEVNSSRYVSYVADQWQLIDLGPHKTDLAAGGAVAKLSAAFNAAEFPVSEAGSEAYRCSFSIHAIDSKTVEKLRDGDPSVLTDAALAVVHSSSTSLDRDPRTWQIEGCALRVPAEASHLMVRVGIAHAFEQRREDFPGHYIDDVYLTLTSTGMSRP